MVPHLLCVCADGGGRRRGRGRRRRRRRRLRRRGGGGNRLVALGLAGLELIDPLLASQIDDVRAEQRQQREARELLVCCSQCYTTVNGESEQELLLLQDLRP